MTEKAESSADHAEPETSTPSERQPVEAWAAKRGHVDPPPQAICDVPAHKAWVFAAAKALHRWPVGKELTLAEYDAAVERALSLPVR